MTLYLLMFENWEREHKEITLEILYATRSYKPWVVGKFYLVGDAKAVNAFPQGPGMIIVVF